MTDPLGFTATRPSEEHVLPGAYRPWLLPDAPLAPERTIDPPAIVRRCLDCARKKCNNCVKASAAQPRREPVTP